MSDASFYEELDAFVATIKELDPRGRRKPIVLDDGSPWVRAFWNRVGSSPRLKKGHIHPPDRASGDAQIARSLHQWPLPKSRHAEVIAALPGAHRLVLDLGLGFWVTDEDRGEDDPPVIHLHTEYPIYRLRSTELGSTYLPLCVSAVTQTIGPKDWVSAPLGLSPLPAGRTPTPTLLPGFRLVDDVWLIPASPGSGDPSFPGWACARSHRAIARLLLTYKEAVIGLQTPRMQVAMGLPEDAFAHAVHSFETTVQTPGMKSPERTRHHVVSIDGIPVWFRRAEMWVDRQAYDVDHDADDRPRIAAWIESHGGSLRAR